jgi:hypothetical protein
MSSHELKLPTLVCPPYFRQRILYSVHLSRVYFINYMTFYYTSALCVSKKTTGSQRSGLQMALFDLKSRVPRKIFSLAGLEDVNQHYPSRLLDRPGVLLKSKCDAKGGT